MDELKSRSDADLIAYKAFGNWDVWLKKFSSRKALEVFCKDGSVMHALVKTPVGRNMLVNKNTQRAT